MRFTAGVCKKTAYCFKNQILLPKNFNERNAFIATWNDYEGMDEIELDA